MLTKYSNLKNLFQNERPLVCSERSNKLGACFADYLGLQDCELNRVKSFTHSDPGQKISCTNFTSDKYLELFSGSHLAASQPPARRALRSHSHPFINLLDPLLLINGSTNKSLKAVGSNGRPELKWHQIGQWIQLS